MELPKRPDYLIYGVDDRPPLPVIIGLGLQQVAAICPYLVLVGVVAAKCGIERSELASMMGLSMLAIGIMTVLQALRKGPIGSGYLCAPVVSATYLSAALIAAKQGGLPLVCGMLVFAGVVESGFSFIGTKLRKMFPPVVSGIIILAVGVDLGLIGLEQFLDVRGRDSGQFHQHLLAAFVTLGTMVGLSVWGKGILRLFCSFIGIVVGFVLAWLLGLLSESGVATLKATPLFGFPDFGILGLAFDVSLALPFTICAIAAGLRAIGVITTCQKITDANWRRPDGESVRKGVLADGIGCAIGGLLGAPGLSAAPSLVGMQKASGASSRIIAVAVAGWLAVLAMMPLLAALIEIMPHAVVGGALVFSGSFMVVAGVEIVVSRPVEMRTTFIVGLSVLVAVSRGAFSSFYDGAPSWFQPLTNSIVTMAVESAFLLNLLFLLGRRRKINLRLGAEESTHPAALLEEIGKQAVQWKIGPELAKRAQDSLRDLLELLEPGDRIEGDSLEIEASFDDYDFIVTVRYKGHLPLIPSQRRISGDMVEEQGFTAGLSGFLSGVYPDKLERNADGEDCTVRMSFQV